MRKVNLMKTAVWMKRSFEAKVISVSFVELFFVNFRFRNHILSNHVLSMSDGVPRCLPAEKASRVRV